MVYPVEDIDKFYSYWLVFLIDFKSTLNGIDPYISNFKSVLVYEKYFSKLIDELDYNYCEQFKTDEIHKLWCYIWKTQLYETLAHISKIQSHIHKKRYDYKRVVDDFTEFQKRELEYIDFQLKILKSEREASLCENQ